MQPTAMKIISAARPLFNRYGLRKTTIDDIARVAGIGKGTVYNYFKDKEEIFLTAKRDECNQFMQKLRAATRKEGSAARQMRAFVACWFEQINAYRADYPLSPDLFAEFEQLPEYAIVMNEYNRDQASLIRGIIETGIENSEFRVLDVEKSTWSVFVTLGGLSMAHYLQGFMVSQCEMPEIIADMLVAALSNGQTNITAVQLVDGLTVTN